MASSLVVGIFSGTDPKTLESALTAQQIDLSKVKVVSTTVTDDDEGSSQLEFVDVIADMQDNRIGRGSRAAARRPGSGPGAGVCGQSANHAAQGGRRDPGGARSGGDPDDSSS